VKNVYKQLLLQCNGLLLSVSGVACAHMTFKNGSDNITQVSKQEYTMDGALFGLVSGLFSKPEFLPQNNLTCPEGGIYSVELRMSAQDVLLTVVTLGLFVPHRATITCFKKS
jgi:hypothetical protein